MSLLKKQIAIICKVYVVISLCYCHKNIIYLLIHDEVDFLEGHTV